MKQIVEKKLFNFEITAFALVAINSPYYKQYTCHVNMLTNTAKISDITKRDIFQGNFSYSDETI